MSVAANQQRTFLRLVAELRPHWRRDFALPARIQALLARHREFGSRDRRLYRELIYTTLRYLPWIEPRLDSDATEAVRRVAWLAAELPATKAFRAAHATGEPPAGDKAELLPAWFRAHCPEVFAPAELEAQLRRAPLWLRLQTDAPERVWGEFESLGWTWRFADVPVGRGVLAEPLRQTPGLAAVDRPRLAEDGSPYLTCAVQLLGDVDVTKTAAFREGRVEVQDLGSQMILSAIGLEPGGQWLDACAGAGGKTLQLAMLLGANGRIVAHDVRPAALEELARRAERAGLSARVSIAAQEPDGEFDGVLVDAPCSGSGTWRRAPHLKWVTTEAIVERAAAQQRALLAKSAARVRRGGRLVYATCSLSRRENEDVIAAFREAHPEFAPAPFAQTFDFVPRGDGLTLLPARHDTDGFFVASFVRK